MGDNLARELPWGLRVGKFPADAAAAKVQRSADTRSDQIRGAYRAPRQRRWRVVGVLAVAAASLAGMAYQLVDTTTRPGGSADQSAPPKVRRSRHLFAAALYLTAPATIIAQPPSQVPLRVKIGPTDAAPPKSFLLFSGLPPAVSVSSGRAIGAGRVGGAALGAGEPRRERAGRCLGRFRAHHHSLGQLGRNPHAGDPGENHAGDHARSHEPEPGRGGAARPGRRARSQQRRTRSLQPAVRDGKHSRRSRRCSREQARGRPQPKRPRRFQPQRRIAAAANLLPPSDRPRRKALRRSRRRSRGQARGRPRLKRPRRRQPQWPIAAIGNLLRSFRPEPRTLRSAPRRWPPNTNPVLKARASHRVPARAFLRLGKRNRVDRSASAVRRAPRRQPFFG